MTSGVPPAIRRKKATVARKQTDRAALLLDADYFLTEVITRLERLVKVEPDGEVELTWRQSAQVTRRTRQIVRTQREQLTHKANHEGRQQ